MFSTTTIGRCADAADAVNTGTRVGLVGRPTYSGRFNHVSGHPSAVGRAQFGESSPVKDQRTTTVPRNQPRLVVP